MQIKNLLIFSSVILITFLSSVQSSLKFEINVDRPRCFYEELFKDSVMMVKWKVSGINEPDEQKAKSFYMNIQLAIIDDKSGAIMKREMFNAATGKISFHASEEGFYKICVTYHGGWHVPYPALIGIKINSDNMDEPNFKKGIKIEDVSQVKQKITNLLADGNEIVKRQKVETEEEDHTALDHIHFTKYYYNMAVFQILVVLALGIYQVFKFRKFLSTNNFI
jgi:hypothetical protein